MAQLELGINVTGLSEAKAGLESLKAIGETLKSSFSGLSVITQALNAENKKLAGELTRAKIETQQLSTAGKALDNQNKELKNTLEAERVAIAKVTKEQKELTLARAKDTKNKRVKGPYAQMASELNDLRNAAKDVGAQMLFLENAGAKSTGAFVTLQRKFIDMQGDVAKFDANLKKLDSSLGQNQRNVGNYTNSLGNASGVTMEFSRIIQDLPFGMMGIGNNLQQLGANWQVYAEKSKQAAEAGGKTVSSMQLVRGVFSQFLTTGNLVTFGIAAITSAWTAYSMKNGKVKAEVEDLNNAFTNQLGTLQNVVSLSKLSAKTERDKATAISLYNKELGDTLGKVKSYSELESKLVNNGSKYIEYLRLKAQAEALYQISLKQTSTMLTNVMSLEQKGRSSGFAGWVAKASDTIDEFVYGEGTQGKTKITSKDALKIAQLPTDKEFYIAIRGMGDGLKRGLKDVRADWKSSVKSADLGADLTQEFNKIGDQLKLKMPDLNLDKVKEAKKATKELVDYLLKLREITTAAEGSVEIAGATGLDAELAKIRQKYAKWQNDITKLYRDGEKARKAKTFAGDFGTFQKEVAGSKGRLSALEGQELIEATRKYTQETTEWISKLWIDAGREQEKGREQDVSNAKDYYDKLLIEHQDNADKITAITAARRFKEEAINQKWDNKALEDVDKIANKITSLERGEFKGKRTDAITNELQRRLYEINAFYDEIEKVLNLNKLDTSGISEARSKSNKEATTQGDLAIKNLFENVKINSDKVISSFRASIGSIIGDIGSLGTKFSDVFSNVFSKLTTGLNDVIIGSFLDELTLKLKDRLSEMGEAGQKMSNAAAGMAIAGQMLGSAFSKTSVGGQGLAGGLKGAASGAMAGIAIGGASGGPIGAAIGGALGIAQGIIAAKQAKKQEELQRRQLEEQKKANALLERMNALAYASQIIGSKTQYGIVHGVNRNAFGEITFRVQGQDLVATLNRQDALNGRK